MEETAQAQGDEEQRAQMAELEVALGTASGEISVPEVMAAVDAATASAPRDRSRLEEMVRRAV